ncbi:UDP-xylose and UDP-N-acetylglucosamine transporter [Coccidioides immitis RMSCC 3703]|uniref:UDP-xylose and UDP-N-acetylglucosamine transporter n=1 Tax=Coccidioides immitis RMSCC 3703 TaxID=454286 RepID=A0A0J8R8N2_COCIT|nr:UDP-xylose and UDP-N-acetylglucosamine transporter [Coccidioides immitis RMSCC 3703]
MADSAGSSTTPRRMHNNRRRRTHVQNGLVDNNHKASKCIWRPATLKIFSEMSGTTPTHDADRTILRRTPRLRELDNSLLDPSSHKPANPNGFISTVKPNNTPIPDGPERVGDIATAVAHATVPAWANVGFMLALIFGGCCANVFTLEAIVTDMPHAGALITFTQFAMTSLLTLPNILSFSAGPKFLFLKARGIPLKDWIIFTAFFMTVNLMNNSAFLFKISVPLHIIIRSGGPVTSMIIGYLYNSKRYTRVQIFAVSMLSIGVVTSALADASAKGKSLDLGLNSSDNEVSPTRTLLGFAILGLAMILAAFQEIRAGIIGAKIKSLLSSPSVLASFPVLASTSSAHSSINSVMPNSSTIPASASTLLPSFLSDYSLFQPYLLLTSLVDSPPLHSLLSRVPLKMIYLLLNALTQYLCIRGVYLLSAKSSSLTVTIVLNIRKLTCRPPRPDLNTYRVAALKFNIPSPRNGAQSALTR